VSVLTAAKGRQLCCVTGTGSKKHKPQPTGWHTRRATSDVVSGSNTQFWPRALPPGAQRLPRARAPSEVSIKATLNAGNANTRPELAATTLPNGKTRMYVYEGHTNASGQYSRLFRSDDVATGVPVFSDLTSNDPANPGYGTFNLCTGQCWYDLLVYTPPGYPDIVYVGGSYLYGEAFSNKRGVMLSTDAGVTSTDMTMDATDIYHPNGLHPDQHALVTHPNNPYQFFEVNDGGVMRSSGEFADVSAWCDDLNRNLTEPRLSRCKQLLSRVPTKLEGLNRGLPTLQFQSLSVCPFNVNLLQGGTQDNGTWQRKGNPVKWETQWLATAASQASTPRTRHSVSTRSSTPHPTSTSATVTSSTGTGLPTGFSSVVNPRRSTCRWFLTRS
jgi:hypothetical protein